MSRPMYLVYMTVKSKGFDAVFGQIAPFLSGFEEGAALRRKRRIPHIDLLIGAKSVVVEGALGGALDERFEVGLHNVVARFDIGKVLGERTALAFDAADALCVFADRDHTSEALIFEVVFAV